MAAAVLAGFIAAPAPAQSTSAELDAAYQAMFDDPTNIDAILEFARLATREGDYEAAIGALERILLAAPGLPSVHADLGLLYQRMGSNVAAKYHVQQVLQASDVDPAVVARAERVLDDIERAESRHEFTASLSLGARYQSNANSGSSSNLIEDVNGLRNTALPTNAQEEEDVNLFAFGRFEHAYDLRWQAASLVTDGYLYATLHSSEDQVDSFVLEATTGPRFGFGANRSVEIRPHVVGNAVFRGGDFNSKVAGLGVDGRWRISSRTQLRGQFQHRYRNFNNTDDRPQSDRRDGHENRVGAEVLVALTSRLTGVLRGGYIERDTERKYLDTEEFGGSARLILAHAGPFLKGPTRYRSHVGVGYRNIDFDGPNPNRPALLSGVVAREDDERRVVVGTTAIISRQWRANVRASYTDVDSNLRENDRDNLAVSLSATRRF